MAQKLGGLDALVNISYLALGTASPRRPDMLSRCTRRTCSPRLTPLALRCRCSSTNGRVIYIGAAGAVKAGLGMGPYAASKAGVAKLAEALAEEVKDRNITVNAILPSTIDTPANRADMPAADVSRWVQPEQVADLIVFLLSDRASAITGALIPIVGRV